LFPKRTVPGHGHQLADQSRCAFGEFHERLRSGNAHDAGTDKDTFPDRLDPSGRDPIRAEEEAERRAHGGGGAVRNASMIVPMPIVIT